MQDSFETAKFTPLQSTGNAAQDILMYVYDALREKGYDPLVQLAGYMISGDPTYITGHKQARTLITRLERDEILEELVRYYLEGHAGQQ